MDAHFFGRHFAVHIFIIVVEIDGFQLQAKADRRIGERCDRFVRDFQQFRATCKAQPDIKTVRADAKVFVLMLQHDGHFFGIFRA